MTTATTKVVKEDTTTPADPFDMGAGRVDLNVAGNPGLTFDATAADMIRLGNDPVNAIHLNLPSVNAADMPGRVTTTRVATNVSGQRLHYDIATTAPSRQHHHGVAEAAQRSAKGQSADVRHHHRVHRPDGPEVRRDHSSCHATAPTRRCTCPSPS